MGYRQTTLDVLAKYQVDDDDLDYWYEQFRYFDQDGSGLIEKKEIGDLLRALGKNPTDDEINDISNRIDETGDGQIDFQEFLLHMLEYGFPDPDEEEQGMVKAFQEFDLNGDGFIEKSELLDILECDEAEVDEMIKEADQNGDGKVDYKEFVAMMCAAPQKGKGKGKDHEK